MALVRRLFVLLIVSLYVFFVFVFVFVIFDIALA